MINEYVDCVELKRLFQDRLLRPENIRHYYKCKGILLPSSRVEDIADQVYTLFLGVRDLEELQDMMNVGGSYIQSAVFQLEDKSEGSEDFLDTLIDDVVESMRWPSYPYVAGRPERIDNNTVRFPITYEKINRGSNRLNAKESREIDINLRRLENGEIFVDVRQSAPSDVGKVIKYLSDLSRKDVVQVDDQEKFKVVSINLEALATRVRVDFFDKIASNKFDEWQLKTITGITIKRGNSTEEDDDEEDSGEEIPEDSGDLAGINQAVLNGQALRNNGFVNSCIEQNFFISSMKYRFQMSGDATEFVVAISTKRKNLHVDIVKSYRDEDGKPIVCPYSKDDQDAIVRRFQELARIIYNELWEKQMRV